MTQPGQIVADRYRIISTLGSGHYGVVFRAEDVSLQKEVALKMLNVTDTNSTALLRFHKEARAAAKLKHSNIVTVLDFRLDDKNNFYLVLELIEGMNLRRLIASHGRLAPDECIPLFLQVLSGLSHAHENGVIHRDLNPNNILVDFRNPQQPTAKLVDFGLARLADEDQRLTREGVAVGTPEFMSPEQCHGTEIDARSDIYSFGCLMFDALTGDPPYKRDTVVDTIMCHINYDAPSLYDVCPDVDWPRHLPEIVAKTLNRDPNLRYQSAEDLAAALRTVPIEAHVVEAEKNISDDQVQPYMVVPEPRRGVLQTIKNVPISVVIAFIIVLIIAAIVVLNGQAGFDKIGAHKGMDNINRIKATVVKNVDGVSGYSTKKRRVKALEASGDAQNFGYNVVLKASEEEDNLSLLDRISVPQLLPSKHISGSFDAVACSDDKDLKLVENHFEISSLRIQTPLRFSGTGLRYLKGLKLTNLQLKNSPVTDKNLAKFLPNIPTLTSLILGGNPDLSGETLKEVAAKVPNVKFLDLTGSGLTDAGVTEIANFKKLEFLSIGKCPYLTGATLGSLSSLANLTELHMLSSRSMNTKYWSCLSKFPSLRILIVSGCRFEPRDLRFLRESKLKALTLGATDATDEDLKEIAACSTLQYVSLENEKLVTPLGISYLKKSNIREYDGSGQTMSNDMVDAICGWKNLNVFRAASTGMTYNQAERLLKNSKIRTLFISSPISQSEVLKLKKQFPGCRIELVPLARSSHVFGVTGPEEPSE